VYNEFSCLTCVCYPPLNYFTYYQFHNLRRFLSHPLTFTLFVAYNVKTYILKPLWGINSMTKLCFLFQATISLDVRYTVPGTDESVDGWSPDEGMDEERLLVDIQQNIANLEKSLSTNQERRASWSHEQATTSKALDKSPAPSRKR
jgi:hypothetical protein